MPRPRRPRPSQRPVRERGSPRPNLSRTVWRELVVPLVVVLGIVLPLRSAVADWNDVPSASMRPTILEGDRIYVNKLAYGLRLPFTFEWLARWEHPQRGDVVTLASPADGIRLVKRVVGLPGDRIAMRDNRLWVNGSPVAYEAMASDARTRLPDGRQLEAFTFTERLSGREHVVTLTPALPAHASFSERVVPDGHYFFLGDNRNVSKDSRIVGSVSLDRIYGRVTHIAASLDPDNGYRPRFERFFSRL